MRAFVSLLASLLLIAAYGQPACSGLQADFVWTNTPNGVQFSNSTTGAGSQTQFSWTFGDGGTSSNPQPFYTYAQPGNYEVCLTALSIYQEPNGVLLTCLDTSCAIITIGQPGDPCDDIIAEFTVTTTGSGSIFYTATNAAGPNWFWDLGDGTFADGVPQGTHTYAQPGTYTICLTVWDWSPSGQITCSDTICQTIVITTTSDPCDQLVAGFTYTSTPNGVLFSNGTTGTGQQTTWDWNFGDGSSSTDAQPFHTYAQPGTYEVCLKVISIYTNIGSAPITCISDFCLSVVVQGTDPCQNFQACFVPSGAGPMAYFFNNCTTNTGTTQFVWDFGDGATGTAVAPTHGYTAPGTYTVCLTAYWQNCVDSTCTTIIVEGGSDPCEGLHASFTYSSTPNGVYFASNSTGLGQQTILSWTFGDGMTGTGSPVVHVYPGPGTYEACLSVISIYQLPNGASHTCVDSTCTQVIVQGGNDPCDALNANFVPVVGGLSVNIQNAVINNQWTYYWSFGDGSTGSGPDPFHTYSVDGTYQVCLWVWTWDPVAQDTCFADHCEWVTVQGNEPCIDVSPVITWNGAGNNTVVFAGTTTLPVDGLVWQFGDGTEGFGQTITHTYAAAGLYEVCLAAWYWNTNTQDTCWSETCQTITVGGGDPCQGLEACFVPNDWGNGVFFFDNCTNGPLGTQLMWDFGDGSTSTITNVEHVFAQPGTYTVCLFAYWQNCVDSTCTTVIVEGGGDPCQGLQASFTYSSTLNGVYFASNSTGLGQQTILSWTFGDGAAGTGSPVVHVYPGPGTYEACLTVTSIYQLPNGAVLTCVDTTCVQVIIQGGNNPCDALNANFDPVVGGLSVNIQNAAINTQWTYHWSFGDGSFGNGPNPFHSYPASGTYQICLTVWTWDPLAQDTCFADHCEWVTVQGNQPCVDANPVISWSEVGNNTVVFAGTTTLPVDGLIWQFGDGPVGFGQTVTHTYPAAGQYQVCLYAWYWNNSTQDTCWSEDCLTITVGGGDPCQGLEACFVPNDWGNGVFFFDNCTTGPIGTQLMWDFGDGSTSTITNVEHSFTQPGTYTVCLTAYWQNCVDSACTTVTVVGSGDPCSGLTAGFTWNSTPNGAQFSNGTTGAGVQTTFHWTFGDGLSSNDPQPFHTYAQPGSYEVCLNATSIYQQPNGGVITCVDTTCSTISVGEGCDPEFACAFTWDGQGTTVVFIGTTNRPTDGMVWEFGDNTVGYGNVVTHLYEPPGPFQACLNAWYWNEATQDSCWTQSCSLVDPFNVVNGIQGSLSETIHLYPQPATDQLTIDGLPGPGTISLFSVDGRLVVRQQTSGPTERMTVGALSAGPYVIQLISAGQLYRRRIVIER